MNVRFHKRFEKEYGKRSVKEQRAFKERLALFRNEPLHPTLRNHPLVGKLEGQYSINVTGDVRALYELHGPDTVLFTRIGSHSQLY